jgi:hypothetical protein
MMVCNIFAFRSTDPSVLKKQKDPVGPLNDQSILAAARVSQIIICGWGAHGHLLSRESAVRVLLRSSLKKLHCLGHCRSGSPRHPLYVGYAELPKVWSPNRPSAAHRSSPA